MQENETKKSGKIKWAAIAVAGAVLLFFGFMFASAMMRSMGGMSGMSSLNDWVAGATLPLDLKTPHPPENENALKAGKAIYEMRCAICHGEKGDGNGEKAKELTVKPTDFSYGMYKFRSTLGLTPTNEDIFKTITRGLHGTAMLPWPGLTTKGKWQVTYFIKTFSDIFEDDEEPQPIKVPIRVMMKSHYEDLGRKVYRKAKCYECHGHDGRGDGEKAGKLKDDKGRPISPRNFREDIFKRGLDIDEIYLTVATGLHGTPMESYLAKKVAEEDILALAYYVRSIAPEIFGGGMMGMMNMGKEEQMGMMIDHVMMPTVYRPDAFN